MQHPFLIKNEEIQQKLIEDLRDRDISPRSLLKEPSKNPYNFIGVQNIYRLYREGLCSPKNYFLLLYHFEDSSIRKENNYFLFKK